MSIMRLEYKMIMASRVTASHFFGAPSIGAI